MREETIPSNGDLIMEILRPIAGPPACAGARRCVSRGESFERGVCVQLGEKQMFIAFRFCFGTKETSKEIRVHAVRACALRFGCGMQETSEEIRIHVVCVCACLRACASGVFVAAGTLCLCVGYVRVICGRIQ